MHYHKISIRSDDEGLIGIVMAHSCASAHHECRSCLDIMMFFSPGRLCLELSSPRQVLRIVTTFKLEVSSASQSCDSRSFSNLLQA